MNERQNEETDGWEFAMVGAHQTARVDAVRGEF